MPATLREISTQTGGGGDVVDLTREVEDIVRQSGVGEGVAIVFVSGSTASVTTIEYEPGAVADLKAALERLVPQNAHYKHNHGGESNGHAHLRAAIVGPSVAIPVTGGRLLRGSWQQVVLVDFDDRPRSRTVHVQIVG